MPGGSINGWRRHDVFVAPCDRNERRTASAQFVKVNWLAVVRRLTHKLFSFVPLRRFSTQDTHTHTVVWAAKCLRSQKWIDGTRLLSCKVCVFFLACLRRRVVTAEDVRFNERDQAANWRHVVCQVLRNRSGSVVIFCTV